MSDEEVICAWMEPKTVIHPGQTTPRELLGSPWWNWSIGYGAYPKTLNLDSLWIVEERLIQQGLSDAYRTELVREDAYFWHAAAAQKIKALAKVLRNSDLQLTPDQKETA